MGDWENLNSDFANRLRGLQRVCQIDVGSGFRTRDEQARLYAEKGPGLAAPPGHSNHEKGVAADLSMLDGSSLTPQAYECIRSHAVEFGLRQPMAHEPWHWEPAGASAAASDQAYTQPADGVQGPPSDPVAGAVATLMDTLLGGGGGLPDVAGLAPPTGAAPQPAGSTPAAATPTAGATPAGGDWQASLSPAERWILTRESGLDPTIKNPNSTAFGIWQGLESTRKQYLGADWQTTDPVKQLDAFRRYVSDRYGTAEAAKAHWESAGWY